MKKSVLILVLVISSVLLIAQQPKVHFYLNDGSSKNYNFSEIDKFSIISGTTNYMLKIFYEDTLSDNYLTKDIDSMKIETASDKYEILSIWTSGELKSFYLSDLDSINFFIPDTPVPQLTSVNPIKGKISDEIIITGSNFGGLQGSSFVSFKGKNGVDYTSWSENQIKVKVPSGALTGKISVTVKGIKSNELDFSIIPVLTSLTPNAGRSGDIITLAGNGFGNSKTTGVVVFSDTSATEFTLWSDVQIKVKVPKGAKTGKVSVTSVNIQSNELDFTILPKIETMIPSSARIGDTVIISGSGLAGQKDTSFVFFNGKKAIDYISRGSTEIILKVPVGTKSEKVYITVGTNKTNEVDFKIIPQLTKITPDSAGITEEIAITGNGFGDKAGSSFVSFNGINSSTFVSWSDVKIVLAVPPDVFSGKVWVTVTDLKSNEVDFTVIQHLISITPESAKIADQITLIGTNFGSSQGASSVFFNNISTTTVDSWSDTEIKLKIPEKSTTGKVSVKIGNKKSNQLDFTIIPQLSGIAPTSGRSGSIVTISGTGFDDNRGQGFVSFTGGTASDYPSWTSTLITVRVPAGIKTGKVSVTASKQTSNELDFTILPTITEIYRSSGFVGDQVTITGISFGDTRGTNIVSFNGANVSTYQSWSDNEIIVIVPNGAKSGKISVTVGINKSNELDFFMIPQITNISPASGPTGTKVTLTGINFGDSRGASIVTFNTADATVYPSWSNTSIQVNVPTNGRTGKVFATVNNIKSNEVDFTNTDIFYETVTIGNQEWMVRNLDSVRYRNGDAIPQVTDNTEWNNLTTGAWCYYNNSSSNGPVYGIIYNWYALNDSRGIGPQGWHVATDNDWSSMITYLGGSTVAGGKLKETGTSHWQSPNTGATNETGFTCLGSGNRQSSGFSNLNLVGPYWTATASDANNAWSIYLLYNSAGSPRYANGKSTGFYARLVRD